MAVSVWPRLPRRQVFLFLIAILVPCLVLVALGLRLIAQERQLDDKRRADERLLQVAQVQQDLLSLLEKMKLQVLARAAAGGREDSGPEAQDAVVFVGALLDGRLRWPWEDSPNARSFREWLNEPSFADQIRDAEAEELVAHRYEAAVRGYRNVIESAKRPAQQSFARLLLARALGESGHRDQSLAEYERVMMSPPDLVDEHGVPLAFYAAPPLVDARLRPEDTLERIRGAIDDSPRLPPVALYLARDLARKLGARDMEARLALKLEDVERAEALQRDLSRLVPLAKSPQPIWIALGEPAWLVSATPPVGAMDALIVVLRAAETVAQLHSPGRPVQVAASTDQSGVSVGESFPGLRLVLPAQDAPRRSLRQTFLASALLVALAFTLMAGYLLWRDVQRDLRLADMRSQFVASVTHELKTPLTAIRMFSETLRLDEDVDRQTRSEYLDTILHESERLSRLVDNVLDFGKIERGKKIYRLEPVRLEEVVEGAARAIQYPFEQAGFALDVAVDRGLPAVRADADALQQAILNLLTNAMKYSGGAREIRLRLERKDAQARIQVVDRGVGIAPEDQTRVLEKFYRAPTVENRHIPGAGLGLTLVAHIVAAHGGSLQIDSHPGVGSTFTINLPLSSDESPARLAGVL